MGDSFLGGLLGGAPFVPIHSDRLHQPRARTTVS